MNFVLRSFAGYLLLIALAALFGYRIAVSELKPAMRQAVEELLVDCANLLAEVATPDVLAGRAGDGALAQAVQRFQERQFNAHIYGVPKTRPDLRVYVTDASGRVLFDSVRANVGKDFASWNDVRRTLNGEYGARATRAETDNPVSSVMYVAAPVRHDQRLTGVLSVGKSSESFEPFVARSQQQLVEFGGALVTAAVTLALALSWWMSRDLHRLSRYALDVSAGKKVVAPRYRRGELATLSTALEKMREELEGKAHVEKFAQLLTHELKSPLSAIRGAAELLDEDMPATDRTRFVGNIRAESERMQAIVERILNLAVIEHRQSLQDVAPIALRELIDELLSARAGELQRRNVVAKNCVDATVQVRGERFLLQQALANLLDNAIAFSAAGERVSVTHEQLGHEHFIRVRDRGPGLPEFAHARLFERFFSLPRPDTGMKSTGLGLAMVKEIAQLHRGRISIANHAEGGVEATLILPA
jgi:two-component system sensor histidine kinase CreC